MKHEGWGMSFFAGALFASLVASSAQIGYDTLIAHRGESYDAPENTLPAYQMAVERGFGFECDIYLSADGQLFTFHDTTLTRTTAGAHNEKCWEASWQDTVSKVNVGGWGKWKGSKFDPTRPAKFEEVLELARDGRYIYVEVKGGNPKWVAPIKAAIDAQKKATPKNVLFITFSDAVAKELRRQLPEYKTYLLLSARRRNADGKAGDFFTADYVIERLKATGVNGLDIQFNAEAHDVAFVKRIHDAGFSCHFWTVDQLGRARQAFAAGGDTLTTNRAKDIYDQDRTTAK